MCPVRTVRAVSASLRLEGRLGLMHDEVHGPEHLGQHMVGFDL